MPVDWLVMDHDNPRLAGVDGAASDESIIAHLYRSEELGELLESIAANGYMNIEPLVVLLTEDDRLLVLEGNRRLAAIRLFRTRDLVLRIIESEGLRITLPVLPDEHRQTLDFISVYRVNSREDARSFIGFKHINGTAKWGSFAKARFAAAWYRSGGVSLPGIAGRIGDKHATVKRMVYAIYVLEQAETAGVFDMDDRVNPRFNFSHLYTALSRTPYMEFLGLKDAWARYEPTPNPVPSENLDNLSEILRWIYGSREDDIAPVVVSQNPDIKRLGEVLEKSEAVAVLRGTGSLDQAYVSVQSVVLKFSDALLKARQDVREAANSLRGFDGRDEALVDIAEDILETVQAIVGRMRKRLRDVAVDDE